MGKKLKWGILGCAAIADEHLIRAIRQSASGEAAAIASRTLEKAERMAAKHGIPASYGSYEVGTREPSGKRKHLNRKRRDRHVFQNRVHRSRKYRLYPGAASGCAQRAGVS